MRRVIKQGQAATTAASVYTVPGTGALVHALFYNTNAAAQTVVVTLLSPDGSTTAVARAVLAQYEVLSLWAPGDGAAYFPRDYELHAVTTTASALDYTLWANEDI